MSQDPFLTLQVDRTATPQQIRRAYYRLVRRYHPDRNQNNPEAIEHFKQVQLAYEQVAHRTITSRPSSVIRATTCGVGSTINRSRFEQRDGEARRQAVRWLAAAVLAAIVPAVWSLEALISHTGADFRRVFSPQFFAAQASPANLPAPSTTTARDQDDAPGNQSRRRSSYQPSSSSSNREPQSALGARQQATASPAPLASTEEATAQQENADQADVVAVDAPTTVEKSSTDFRPQSQPATVGRWDSVWMATQRIGNAWDIVQDQLETIPQPIDSQPSNRSNTPSGHATASYRSSDEPASGNRSSGDVATVAAGAPLLENPLVLPELSTIRNAGQPQYRSLAFEQLPAAIPLPIPPSPRLKRAPTTLPPISYTSQWETPTAELPIPAALKALPK